MADVAAAPRLMTVVAWSTRRWIGPGITSSAHSGACAAARKTQVTPSIPLSGQGSVVLVVEPCGRVVVLVVVVVADTEVVVEDVVLVVPVVLVVDSVEVVVVGGSVVVVVEVMVVVPVMLVVDVVELVVVVG